MKLKKLIIALVSVVATAGLGVGGVLLVNQLDLFHQHDFSWETYVLESPTCQKEGKEKRSCSCGESEVKPIPVVPHNLCNVADRAPTCTEDGWKERKYCDFNCGYVTETVIPGGHIYADGLCERCWDIDPDYPATAGLGYELLADNTYAVTGYSADVRNPVDIIIPSTYKGLPVTAIAEKAFCGASYSPYPMTSVTIPDSITTIGKEAFKYCRRLYSLTIPDSVVSIGDKAFYGCDKLIEICNQSDLLITAGSMENGYVGYYAKNIYRPSQGESKLSVDGYGFVSYVDGLEKYLVAYEGEETNLILPEATAIYDYAFVGKFGLKSVVIPDSVQTIGYGAFVSSENLQSVKIGNGVTTIYWQAFCDCKALTTLIFGDSIEMIDREAFAKCVNLSSITLPGSVKIIDTWAFAHCDNLASVTINATELLRIAENTFEDCPIQTASVPTLAIPAIPKTNLETLVISSGEKIKENAFSGCNTLTTVYIAESVTSIGNNAFYGCPIVTAYAPTWAISYLRNSNLKTFTITAGTTIEENAFAGCTQLTTVTIPKSVRVIEAGAFADCASLKEAYFEVMNWKLLTASGAIHSYANVSNLSDKRHAASYLYNNRNYTWEKES